MRAVIAALAILVVAGCGGGEDDPPSPLVGRLWAGGNIIVMRHALTESAAPPRESLRSCAQQRNLSGAGREQATRIGEHIRALGIPITEVRASPMCRTMQTAELAFGDAIPDRRLLSPGIAGTIEDDDRRARALRGTVKIVPPAGDNYVYVTHTGNIGALDESVVEGELLVYAAGRLEGRLTPDELAALAPPG